MAKSELSRERALQIRGQNRYTVWVRYRPSAVCICNFLRTPFFFFYYQKFFKILVKAIVL